MVWIKLEFRIVSTGKCQTSQTGTAKNGDNTSFDSRKQYRTKSVSKPTKKGKCTGRAFAGFKSEV